MDFYVSWSHSDPLYQLYDTQCCMLISLTAISGVWQLTYFPRLPHKVMLDSGSYSYVANNLPLPKPKEAFKRQLAVLSHADVPAMFCAVDRPILDKSLSLTEKNKAIDKTIANAWELKTLIAAYDRSNSLDKYRKHPIEPLAVIQGYDLPSLKHCARQLQEMGHSRFGIGSMAHLYNTAEIVKRVTAVQAIVGPAVHVFGVSAVETMKVLSTLGIISVDSARPIKAAIYNEILYSEPYRRYGIAGSHFQSGNHKFHPQRLVDHLPIVCPCPICKNAINDDILKLGIRKYLLQRAIHNYYHVKKMIVGWHESG